MNIAVIIIIYIFKILINFIGKLCFKSLYQGVYVITKEEIIILEHRFEKRLGVKIAYHRTFFYFVSGFSAMKFLSIMLSAIFTNSYLSSFVIALFLHWVAQLFFFSRLFFYYVVFCFYICFQLLVLLVLLFKFC